MAVDLLVAAATVVFGLAIVWTMGGGLKVDIVVGFGIVVFTVACAIWRYGGSDEEPPFWG